MLFYSSKFTYFSAKFTILFSHTNAADLGLVATRYLLPFNLFLQCNVCMYDYTGYGIVKNGKSPSEKRSYADVQAAFDAIKEKYNVSIKLRTKREVVVCCIR